MTRFPREFWSTFKSISQVPIGSRYGIFTYICAMVKVVAFFWGMGDLPPLMTESV